MATVSQSIIKWAKKQGVNHIFMVPGSQIDAFNNAVVQDSDICPIVACHELGAGYMADGYARIRRGVAIAASTGGPGSLYMLPAAVNARVERVPVLFITGDVPSWLGSSHPFQNTREAGTRDQLLYEQGTDNSIRLDEPKALCDCLHACDRALQINHPVHLALPFDTQSAEGPAYIQSSDQHPYDFSCIDQLATMWNQSRSPLLLLGNRLAHTTNPALIRTLVEHCGVPAATTHGAKGVLIDDHPLSLGNFGYGGTIYAHRALLDKNNDLLLVIGATLGQREDFDWVSHSKHKTIVRMDIKILTEQTGFTPDLELTVDSFDKALQRFLCFATPRKMHKRVEASFRFKADEQGDQEALDVYIKLAQSVLPSNTVLFVDAGRHRLIAARSWKIITPGTFYASNDQAPMGWAIAAAIGAKLARPEAPMLVLTGDGSMRMLGLELAVAVRYQIHLIVVVANNRGYGSVSLRTTNQAALHQFGDLPDIDWADFARNLGATGIRVKSESQFSSAIGRAMCETGPFIIDLCLDQVQSDGSGYTSVWPQIK